MPAPKLTKRSAATMLVTAWLLAAGCAGIGKPLKIPEVRLAGLAIQKADLFESEVQVRLRLINPNDIALAVNGIEFRLAINGNALASGAADSAVVIPALGDDTLTLTVRASTLQVASSLMEILQGELQAPGKMIAYRLEGKLRMGGSVLLPPVIPFEKSDSVSLDALLKNR
jgi:LEA14-like dessication related protein